MKMVAFKFDENCTIYDHNFPSDLISRTSSLRYVASCMYIRQNANPKDLYPRRNNSLEGATLLDYKILRFLLQ